MNASRKFPGLTFKKIGVNCHQWFVIYIYIYIYIYIQILFYKAFAIALDKQVKEENS